MENLTATELVDQTEPLLLDGLGKYAIRYFLQQQDEQTSAGILQDQFLLERYSTVHGSKVA
ncbi:MAG: hypothetical protein U1F28_01025 [Acinetobacter sp.]